MREFLIELGKVFFASGVARTNNGQPPQEWQCYGLGLFMFIYFCVCAAILVIISIITLVKHLRGKNQNEIY